MSSSSSASSDRSRSRSRLRDITPSPGPDLLRNLRILIQDHPTDPFDTPDIDLLSPMFRIVAFALQFGISMLETEDARIALTRVGRGVMTKWRSRDRRTTAYYQDPRMRGGFNPDDARAMRYAVDTFVEQLRIDPPNVFVSTRVDGDGMTERLSWLQYNSDFSAKWSVIFRLNKWVSLPYTT